MERLEIVHVDPVGKVRRDNSPRKPQQRGGPRKPGLPTVQFINTIHPSESASPRSLTLIRSHVAKHARALQRERRQQAQRVPPPRTPPLRVEIRSRPLQRHDSETRQQTQESDSNEEEPINQNDQMNEVRPGKRHGTQARRPQLPANETTMLLDPDDEELLLIRNRAPSPIQLIGGARGDAHHGFARPLSNDEQYLFDFYFDYVIMYGYQACHHKEDATAFAAAMRTVWVPFAMTEPSLMAAIFHVACRNYASITDNTNTTKFTLQKLQYRQMCLNMAMEAISAEEIATDATISLALLMASESYFEGDVEAFCAHGRGIIKMVAGRGGLKSLGLYGFLRKLVGWSIYNPKNYIVLGPEEQD